MVRLKAGKIWRVVTLGYSPFQFQYGAIKGQNPAPVSYLSTTSFQFQYGAIKGIIDVLFGSVPVKFQFQYGAIKGSGSASGACVA